DGPRRDADGRRRRGGDRRAPGSCGAASCVGGALRRDRLQRAVGASMIGRGSIVFAAVHMGPYQSLAAVEPLLSVRPLWAVGGLARHRRAQRGEPFVDGAAIAAAGGGAAFLRAVGARVVVRGTSDDVDDDNVEDVVADGAGAIGLPVLVVEDFPGNFQSFLKQDGDALCVETEAVAELHTTRGTAPARIHVTGNPRYDALRHLDA